MPSPPPPTENRNATPLPPSSRKSRTAATPWSSTAAGKTSPKQRWPSSRAPANRTGHALGSGIQAVKAYERRRVAPAGFPARAPSEPCVPLVAAHGSSKPRGRCGLKRGFRALAGVERPLAGCVHEAGLVAVGRAWSAVGEIAGGYRLGGGGER